MTTKNGRTVVLAMDGSHFSAFAFHWYQENVHTKTDKVILVYCQEMHFHFTGHSPEPSMLMCHYQKESERSQEMRESLEQRLTDNQMTGHVRCEHGDPGHVIVRVAEEEKADVIVTGCRGQGTVRRTLLGSVSDFVLHHAKVPVIVCRHKSHGFQHGNRQMHRH